MMPLPEQPLALQRAFDEQYLARFRWLKGAAGTPYSPWPPGQGRVGALEQRVRFSIHQQAEGICYLCGLAVDVACDTGPYAMTIDHIIPLCSGGPFASVANLALAHLWCNQQKGPAPFPRTLHIRDSWRCARCHEAVAQSAHAADWHWNQPIIEHLVPLAAVEIWQRPFAWTCHLRCHAFRHPRPPR
ncbi:MAG: HNH endonuclease [Ktedonobacterales bacterium]|nr:HNH endonuclease [Ktedonobacterales bacterium]